MLLTVTRKWETEFAICGELSIDGDFFSYTIEPAREKPIHPGHPCIPAGDYAVRMTMSPHLKYVTPEILNVPDRTAIRIHVANGASELLGCTGVGSEHKPNWVSNSKDTFARLMKLLLPASGIRITYIDPPKGEDSADQRISETVQQEGDAGRVEPDFQEGAPQA